jgi:formylglycine-generating enzyme
VDEATARGARRGFGAILLVGLAACTPDPTTPGATSSIGTGGSGGAGGTSVASSSGSGGAGGSGGQGGTGGAMAKACPTVAGTPNMVAVASPLGVEYCIDSTEVTNAQYIAWLDTNPDPTAPGMQPRECASNATFTPSAGKPPSNDRPVVDVDWCDAYAFCKAHGKRLCGRIGGGATPYADNQNAAQDQWYNACSSGGTREYPYGDTYDPQACNVSDKGVSLAVSVGSLPTCEGGFTGIFDMSGNAWEWEDSCEASTGPDDSCRRRGGAYVNDEFNVVCKVGKTQPRGLGTPYVGFRCCAD